MKLTSAIAALLFVSGCICCNAPDDATDSTTTLSTIPKDDVESTTTTTLTAIPKDEASCLALGGRWDRIGMNPRKQCNLPTADAGRVCSDSSDCEGTCLAGLTDSQMNDARAGKSIKITGACTPWRITVGCQARVQSGKVEGILCLD